MRVISVVIITWLVVQTLCMMQLEGYLFVTGQWLNKKSKLHSLLSWLMVQILLTFSHFLNVNWVCIMGRFHLNKTEFVYRNLKYKRHQMPPFSVKGMCVCNMKVFSGQNMTSDLSWACSLVKVKFFPKNSKCSTGYLIKNSLLSLLP